jgi:uncharacterized protein YdeI (BOF family)
MFQIPDRLRRRPVKMLAALVLFASGCGIGVAATRMFWPPHVMAPAKAMPVASLVTLTQPLTGQRVVAVRGKVAAVYGSQFVLEDTSGQILIGIGHRGKNPTLVKQGDRVAVQGYYDDGGIVAIFLTGADGQVTALRGGRGAREEHGGRRGREHHGPGPTAMPAPSSPPSFVPPGSSIGSRPS